MVTIRKAGCLDKFKLKKVMSFLSDDAVRHYVSVLKPFPYMTLHDLLPLQLKFLPENFLIEENKEILGMITVTKTHGNSFKLNISRLFLDKDYYNVGKQLIDFVVSKYGAKGASSFIAIIDDSNSELLELFVNACSFRICSSEQLWDITDCQFSNSCSGFRVRPFKSSDAPVVAEMFNDSVIQHFKYTISRTKNEYSMGLFRGLSAEISYRYVVMAQDGSFNSYFSIITSDDVNFVLTITSSPWADNCPYELIVNFARREVTKRNKNYKLYVRLRKYTTTATSLENFLKEKNASFVQNQAMLVRDFYKVVKEVEPARKAILFNNVEKPAFKVVCDD